MSYNATRDFRAYLYSRFYAFSYEKNNPREWCVKHRQRIGIHSSMYLCIIASYTCDWELVHKNSLPYCTTTARAIQFPFWIWRKGKKWILKLVIMITSFEERKQKITTNSVRSLSCVCVQCARNVKWNYFVHALWLCDGLDWMHKYSHFIFENNWHWKCSVVERR